MKVSIQFDTDYPYDNLMLERIFGGQKEQPVARVKTGPIGLVVDNTAPETDQTEFEEEPEPLEEPEDDPEPDPPAKDYTELRNKVLERASDLTKTEAGVVRVKEALKIVGARRVTKVEDDQLEAFAAALEETD